MKRRTGFYCTECGNEQAKWSGKCPVCGAWNTMEERPETPSAPKGNAVRPARRKASPIGEIPAQTEIRFPTGLSELDRVLGGGAVQGSLSLVAGAPGIGKSTLLLQICGELCKARRVLYVSGEESDRQIRLRADRLGVSGAGLLVYPEPCLEDVLGAVEEERPDVLIVDSIQTMYSEAVGPSAGSVSQVKECGLALMRLAKGRGTAVFVIGHVNKEGAVAGPKVLEHMVDCVLYFEGDRHGPYRILRAVKDRFGATDEIGVFEMGDRGLIEVPDPSQALLSGRPEGAPGACVGCVMEGGRPVLAEIQALVVSSNSPRRSSNGFDYDRAVMLLAVLEKRAGLRLSACDAYLNAVGGLHLGEPAADLPAVLALASSYLDRPVPSDLAAVGEVGLTGELRPVHCLGQRIAEAARLGFRTCVVPVHGSDRLKAPPGMRLLPARDIGGAIRSALGPPG